MTASPDDDPSAAPLDDLDEPPPPSRTYEIPKEIAGASPGTLRIESDEKPRIFLLDYNATRIIEKELGSIDECVAYLEADGESITWIDIRGIGDAPTFHRLAEIFKIHPLALEDLVNTPQRPKSEIYPEQHIFVSRMVTLGERGLQTEQFGILFGKGFVVTVQEEPHVDCLDPVRARLRQNRGLIRKVGSDYLAYALLDAVIDGFYPVLEAYGERLDDLEVQVLGSQRLEPTDIFDIKRELLQLRRAIWPQRDLLAQLLRDESPHIREETRRYYRDTYDHSVQIMDMVETFREIASSLMDLQMTGVSNRMNEVMKVLTVVSTIFLPMTFVAGVYGMNFDTESSKFNMPELKWPLGYPFSLALMAVSASVLLLYYRSRGWIGGRGDIVSRVSRKLGRPVRSVARGARSLGRAVSPERTKKPKKQRKKAA